MSTSIASSFQMTDYKIHKLCFDKPLVNADSESSGLSYFAVSRQEFINGSWHGSVALGFKLSAEANGANDTFFEGIILGTFDDSSCTEVSDGEEFTKRLRINGTSTLIPIIRAAACTGSSLMGFPGKYTLPNINVFALEWSDGKSAQ